VVADATRAEVCSEVIETYRPRTLVLNAGAPTVNLPLPEQSWSSFSRNWEVDVRHAFEWTRAALVLPLDPGSRVLSISSGAALRGSPVSGGYAGAKATVRFISAYAAEESDRAAMGVGFTSLLPQLTPATGFGATAVAAYANRQGADVGDFTAALGVTLRIEQVAAAALELCRPSPANGESHLLTPAGLSAVDS
jgi:NAD(P)-dependent dehydrogenase (short-subunit alcohol dehydrogenase family)